MNRGGSESFSSRTTKKEAKKNLNFFVKCPTCHFFDRLRRSGLIYSEADMFGHAIRETRPRVTG